MQASIRKSPFRAESPDEIGLIEGRSVAVARRKNWYAELGSQSSGAAPPHNGTPLSPGDWTSRVTYCLCAGAAGAGACGEAGVFVFAPARFGTLLPLERRLARSAVHGSVSERGRTLARRRGCDTRARVLLRSVGLDERLPLG